MELNDLCAKNLKMDLYLYISKKVYLAHTNLKYCESLDVKKKFLLLRNDALVY